jgi:hypothetical protein
MSGKKSWKKRRAEQMLRESVSVNKQGVRVDGAGMIVVDRPAAQMTKKEALYHAVYLVVFADETTDMQPFIEALAKVNERLSWESQQRKKR